VIINNFHLKSVTVVPFEANSPLVVDSYTPLLHKDALESTAYSHQKGVSTLRGVGPYGPEAFLRITSKGHHWIDPGDNIDLTAIPLWVRVGFTPLEIPVVATRNRAGDYF